MEKYFEALSQCPLFAGIEKNDYHFMIECLKGKTVSVVKKNAVLLEGDAVRYVGVVLSGMLQVIREDFYGNRSVMTILRPGAIFCEAFVCAGIDTMPVSVVAYENSVVLLLDFESILTACSKDCSFQSRLVQNLLRGMARKNIDLTKKIRYMSQKTTKEKIMEYLLDQAKEQRSNEFVIPFNRQSLADYLGVERSAMSAELGRLKASGQIETHGSWFCIKC